jgi:hypothetical protein
MERAAALPFVNGMEISYRFPVSVQKGIVTKT